MQIHSSTNANKLEVGFLAADSRGAENILNDFFGRHIHYTVAGGSCEDSISFYVIKRKKYKKKNSKKIS